MRLRALRALSIDSRSRSNRLSASVESGSDRGRVSRVHRSCSILEYAHSAPKLTSNVFVDETPVGSVAIATEDRQFENVYHEIHGNYTKSTQALQRMQWIATMQNAVFTEFLSFQRSKKTGLRNRRLHVRAVSGVFVFYPMFFLVGRR